MKKLVLLAVFSAVAFAGTVEYGPVLGYWIPTGDAADGMNGSLYFGGQFISHMPSFAVEGSIGYTPMNYDIETPGYDYSGHMIPITAGLRGYSGMMYGVGGLELDIISAKVEGTQSGVPYSYEDSDSKLGCYFGGGIIMPASPTMDLDLSAKAHYVDFDNIWIGLSAGINF